MAASFRHAQDPAFFKALFRFRRTGPLPTLPIPGRPSPHGPKQPVFFSKRDLLPRMEGRLPMRSPACTGRQARHADATPEKTNPSGTHAGGL